LKSEFVTLLVPKRKKVIIYKRKKEPEHQSLRLGEERSGRRPQPSGRGTDLLSDHAHENKKESGLKRQIRKDPEPRRGEKGNLSEEDKPAMT